MAARFLPTIARWFNRIMPDESAVTDQDRPAPARTSTSRNVFVGACLVVLVAAAGLAIWRSTGSSSAADTGDAPRFVDDTGSSRIDHSYEGAYEFFVGGGVAAFDCDDDGRAELYFAGGTAPAALYRNESEVGGALRFEPVPSPITDLTSVTGAYPLDVDSDGIMDLAVLRRGTNTMLRGLGDCRFEAADGRLGLDSDDDWTTAFSATWEGTNSLPTLAIGNYRVPDGDTCGDNQLIRPTPGGDAYDAPIALTPGYCTLSVLFSDWDRSGRRDLRMANDRNYYIDGEEQLWRIAEGEPPRRYTETDGWRPLQIWGMGIASQDLTGDGYPEVFLTSQGDNKLQTLERSVALPAYEDMALAAGVTAQRPYAGGDELPSTAWHPQFEDVNNDGLVDLLITKGNVEAQADYARRDPNNLMLGRADGTFVEGAEAAGIVEYERARGAALVDLNLDGMLDLVVVNREANPTVWRNVGRGDSSGDSPMGHWLAVDIEQPAPNVDAIGAWIEVRTDSGTMIREVTVGGGHASGQSGWIHAGLGPADAADVRVTWPDGEVGEWISVGADQFVTIARGDAEATVWQPPTG